jgi:hypothetical protein
VGFDGVAFVVVDRPGVKVFIYTLDRAEEYENALALGAYGWVCDEVDEAAEWLQNNGA